MFECAYITLQKNVDDWQSSALLLRHQEANAITCKWKVL